jgi:hypothetical protein
MRLPQLFGLGLLAVALLVSTAPSQDKDKVKPDDKKEEKDKKEDKKPDEKKKEAKKKDGFMAPFKGIDFTAEQMDKITGIRKEFKPKVDELTKKLNELKKSEFDEVLKLLTADQRKIYDENTMKKKVVDKKDDKKVDDKKPDEKKKDDKDEKKDK